MRKLKQRFEGAFDARDLRDGGALGIQQAHQVVKSPPFLPNHIIGGHADVFEEDFVKFVVGQILDALHAAHRKGIGRGLYARLFALLRTQGYVNAYGIITLPNAASVGLHEAMGFQPIGTYRHVGYKHGTWLDVGWWHLALMSPPPAPREPVAFPDLDTAIVERVLDDQFLTG